VTSYCICAVQKNFVVVVVWFCAIYYNTMAAAALRELTGFIFLKPG